MKHFHKTDVEILLGKDTGTVERKEVGGEAALCSGPAPSQGLACSGHPGSSYWVDEQLRSPAVISWSTV